MNPIQKQIASYISDTETQDNKIIANCNFPSDFIGFQGHFPDNPILPGICMIQTVMAIASLKQSRSMQEIVQAKFFNTVAAGETCRFELNVDGDQRINATVSRGDDKIAKIKLLIKES